MHIFQELNREEINFIIGFLFEKTHKISFIKKLFLVIKFFFISIKVDCYHDNMEMLTMAKSIFSLPQSLKGAIVEAGSYKGGSTAKLSLIAKIVRRKLIVFDSFQGIPLNKEIHRYNHQYQERLFIFFKGMYKGSLDEVKENIKKYGVPEVCSFKKGLFNKTMPKFRQKIAAMFLDVDLASSTRTCLKYLYPLLQPNGILYSHDGHFVLVVNVFKDKKFWKNEVGFPKPAIPGLGKQKFIKIVKPF